MNLKIVSFKWRVISLLISIHLFQQVKNEDISSPIKLSKRFQNTLNEENNKRRLTKMSEIVAASEGLTHDVETMKKKFITKTRDASENVNDKAETVLSYTTTHVVGCEDDLQHKCSRKCNVNTQKEKCHYKFKVELYLTMSKACYECPHNTTDCLRPHCVAADGHVRTITTVNRRLPGPSIHVCEGDEVIVDVSNEFMSESTSIHWHGLHMIGTQYMDGVPLLTQCPINPGASFRYHFIADPVGTHYWHSHSGLQRADGVFGLFVVRSKNDPHFTLYDEDDPRHMMVLTDWSQTFIADNFARHYHLEKDNAPYNILVNGLGKYEPLEENGTFSYPPLYEFRVKQGLRYRFRTLSNSVQNCPIEISVDNHTMLVISSDGRDIQPLQVDSLVIYGGERWDFVLNANKSGGVYWVKFRGLIDCDEIFKAAYQVAVLRYEGAEGLPGDLVKVNYNSTKREGFQLNKLNAAPGDHKTFCTAADIRNQNLVNVTKYAQKPDHTFWLDFDFYDKDSELFHHEDFYPFYGVKPERRVYLPQINNISLMLPKVPPLSQPNELDPTSFCNSTSRSDCDKDFCYCSHILNIKLGGLVELILIDTGMVYWANHPFHLHGHVFAVLGMERLGEETTLQAVKDLEKKGKLQRNFIDPPFKDTVTVPDGGYTVIRFMADNPGYWFLHCHLAFHVEIGMGLVFHTGEEKDVPPVPDNFPKCRSWMPEPVEDLQAQIDEWMNTEHPTTDGKAHNCQIFQPLLLLSLSAIGFSVRMFSVNI